MSISPYLSVIVGIGNLQTSGFKITDPRWDQSKPEYWWLDKCPPLPSRHSEENYINLSDSERRIALRNDAIIHHITCPKVPQGIPTPREGSDLIEWNSEYGCPEVMGYQLDSAYSKTWLYGLASVFPKFQQKGWRYLPSIPLEEDKSIEAHLVRLHQRGEILSDTALYQVQKKLKLIKNGWNYPYFSCGVEQHMAAACYLLNWIGLQVKEEELKLILYWKWS